MTKDSAVALFDPLKDAARRPMSVEFSSSESESQYSSEDEATDDDDFSRMQMFTPDNSKLDSWRKDKKRRLQEIGDNGAGKLSAEECKKKTPRSGRGAGKERQVQSEEKCIYKGLQGASGQDVVNSERILVELNDDPVLNRAKADRERREKGKILSCDRTLTPSKVVVTVDCPTRNELSIMDKSIQYLNLVVEHPSQPSSCVRISQTTPLEHLLRKICETWGLDDTLHYLQTADQETMLLGENAMFYLLRDGDRLKVCVRNGDRRDRLEGSSTIPTHITPCSISLKLRVNNGDTYILNVDPEDKVSCIFSHISKKYAVLEDEILVKSDGERLLPHKTIADYELEDDYLVDIVFSKQNACMHLLTGEQNVLLTLRFNGCESVTCRVSKSSQVSKLQMAVAKSKHTVPSKVTMKIDGQTMSTNQLLETYDLEDGDIIDIVIEV